MPDMGKLSGCTFLNSFHEIGLLSKMGFAGCHNHRWFDWIFSEVTIYFFVSRKNLPSPNLASSLSHQELANVTSSSSSFSIRMRMVVSCGRLDMSFTKLSRNLAQKILVF